MCVRGFLRAVIPVASDALHAGLLWVHAVGELSVSGGSGGTGQCRCRLWNEKLGQILQLGKVEHLTEIFLHVHIASCYCISDRYHIFFAFVPAFCLIMVEAQSFSGLSSGH